METTMLEIWSGTRRTSVHFVALFVLFFSFMAAAEGKVTRIDTHAHFVPPFYYDILSSRGLTAGELVLPEWNVDDHLAFMDSHNIELSVLSVSTPGARLAPTDSVEDGRKLARRLNEYGHMLTTTYPERFQLFAILTLPDVEGSVAEAIYALDTLKAAGVALMASVHGEYLGSPKFDPLMDVLDARGAVVFIHPSQLDCPSVENDVGGEKVKLPAYMVDFLLDTTRAAVNLLRMNVLTRYPNIKFLLSHAGGFLPFAAYRVTASMSYLTGEPTRTFLAEIQKFYVDIALSSSSSSLPSVLGAIPNNQITYGSDYPYAKTYLIEECIRAFEEYPLEDKQRHQIDFLIANRLFEKSLQHWRSAWHKDADRQMQGPQTI